MSAAAVKLDFNSDFTNFLSNDDYNDPVTIVIESGTIKCNATLLAQHSSVLRENLKQDKELFLTDNKHVRECLSILYGGSIELTEENFHDILKFMVCFDVRSAQDQVLDWMSQRKWNLDDAKMLINGSMAAIRSCVGVADIHGLREKVYKPCRLFLGQRLTDIINPSSSDVRYKNIDKARERILGRVTDRKEQLAMLLHQDLIPEYIDWIESFIDQSVYHDFLKALDRLEISNKMSLCTRNQFEKLFDKLENLEGISFQEYKNLNKYKLKIHEKMGTCQSLRLMKENGNLYSCWKVLDLDALSIVPIVCSNTADQFCIVENVVTWVSTKKTGIHKNSVTRVLLEAFENISNNMTNSSFQNYAKIVTEALKGFKITLRLPVYSTQYRYHVHDLEIQDWIVGANEMNSHHGFGFGRGQGNTQEIIDLCIYAGVKDGNEPQNQAQVNTQRRLTVNVKLTPGRIPEVNCMDDGYGRKELQFKIFVYAWKLTSLPPNEEWHGGPNSYSGSRGQENSGPSADTPIGYHYIPLYGDPAEAFNTLKQYQEFDHRSGDNRLVSLTDQLQTSCVKFHFVCVTEAVPEDVDFQELEFY